MLRSLVGSEMCIRDRYKTNPVSWNSRDTIIETVPGNVHSVVLRKLVPMTNYQVRVKCENNFGSSDYSDIVDFATLEKGNLPLFGDCIN